LTFLGNFLFQKGLSSIEREDSSVKCFPTFVRALPNGNERGKFLSLDLGGTNFRVIVMELTPDKEFIMDNKIYAIPQTIMTGMKVPKLGGILQLFSSFLKVCIDEKRSE